MFQLKPLSKEAIPRALEKAQRYRLLNEPVEAESICHDILLIDPDNQDALVTLLLALTEQFDKSLSIHSARDIVPRLKDEYSKTYYAGLICERAAKATLDHGGPGSAFVAFERFREAMHWYEKAEAIRPSGNDDAVLRWNTCARIIDRNSLHPAPQESAEQPLE